MFRSITFNGTENKSIGAPILRRTNKMISEFDLQYEKYYKIVKVVSQRELEFQAYLKQQEALQFHLENLIKILKVYFKENNYNENTYYNMYKLKKSPINKRRKRRKKRGRPKTVVIRRNKYLFYRVIKNNYYFKMYKPYLYPLTNQDKKEHERKIFTDASLKQKEDAKLYNMTPSQLKKFVDVFGFLPTIFKKVSEDKERPNKKYKNRRNFSTYIILNNRNRKNMNNKNKLSHKRDVDSSRKFIRLGNLGKNKFSTNNLKSYSHNNIMNNKNNISNIKSTTSINFNKNNYYNLDNNKYMQLLKRNINKNIFKKSIIDKLLNNISPKNNNNIYVNNRYLNIIRDSSKSINNNFLSFSSINTPKLKSSSINNKNDISRNSNFLSDDNNSIKKNKIKNVENIKINTFSNDCLRTIQKSELLTRDIQFMNKLHDMSQDNFNDRKNQIEKKNFGKVDYISFMHIYRRDFKPDIIKEKEKKYEHIKEDMKGHIRLNKVDFIKKDRNKLDFVKIYNKRREQRRLNKEDYIYHNNNEEKNDLTTYKNPKFSGNIRIARNKIVRFKNICSSYGKYSE